MFLLNHNEALKILYSQMNVKQLIKCNSDYLNKEIKNIRYIFEVRLWGKQKDGNFI